MVLQLDPRLPLVWRDPHSVQFGVDAPVVVLEALSNAEERMVAALVSGVTRGGLELVAESAGVTAACAALLLERLAPALRPPAGNTAAAPPQIESSISGVMVSGAGSTAEHVRAAIIGTRWHSGSEPATAATRLAVIVAHYVVDPADRGRWLRRDIPHLPIVLGDTQARLGPFVEPGNGPCLHCLELHRTAKDPAWPAIASQLWGRQSPIESPLFAGELAAQARRMVITRLAAGASDEAVSVTIDAASGIRRFATWVRHPECGCGAPPGIDSGAAPLPAAVATLPKRGAAALAHV